MEEHNPIRFNDLCLNGDLWTYLADLNEQAQSYLELIIEQIKAAEGETESMKATDQMAWVGVMNGIRNRAEEQVYANPLKNSRFRDIMIVNIKEEFAMAVIYKKLFHLLIDKGMTNAELMEKAGFSANIITRIKRDKYISLDSIEKICKVLNCGVDDILEFLPDNTEEE